MSRYMVSFELPEVDPDHIDLEVAYAAAQQVVKSGLEAWGYRSDHPITVSCPAEPAPRTETRWAITAKGHSIIHPKRALMMAFDAQHRRGAVLVCDDEPAEPTQHTVYLEPREVARVVRAIMGWPLDMLEQMAAEDEAKRRGGK